MVQEGGKEVGKEGNEGRKGPREALMAVKGPLRGGKGPGTMLMEQEGHLVV